MSGLEAAADGIAKTLSAVVAVPVISVSRHGSALAAWDGAISLLLVVDATAISPRRYAVLAEGLHAAVRVMVVGVEEADEREILQFVHLGVSGFVLGEPSIQQLQVAVRAAIRGEFPWPRRVREIVARQSAAFTRRKRAPHEHLTSRQREVARLKRLGMSRREIATALGIEESTVHNHLVAIYAILGVPSWLWQEEDWKQHEPGA